MHRDDPSKRFDAAFYRRFYLNRRTRVITRREVARRVDLIGAFVRLAGLPVRSILDAGCGLGLFRPPLLEQFPAARYTGLEASHYVCERYGWICGSVATFAPPRPFDLVICYDVLQYLGDREASIAMRNLGYLCRGALHFGALTREDWDLHCDRRHTDRNVRLRPAVWYRRRLAAGFFDAGSGMFLRRDVPARLWELERR
jgi:SAM-dependent methyltransferase